MTAMVWIAAVFFAAAGVGLILKRRTAANVQSFLAGGSMHPGCAVAEGIAVILLGVLVVVAWVRGWV